MRVLKVFNIILTVLLSIAFVLLGIFVFNDSYERLFEAVKDLWASIRYYLYFVFDIGKYVEPTVNNYSTVLEWDINIAEDFEKFKVQVSEYFSLLINEENLLGYSNFCLEKLVEILEFVVMAMPFVLVIWLIIKKLYSKNNVKHNKDTIPLKVFKFICKLTYQPIKKFIVNYYYFLRRNRVIVVLWCVLWAVQLNLASIIVSFFAYYLVFFSTFEVESLYVQFCKLIIDAKVFFELFPPWLIIVIVYIILARLREKIAVGKLRHYEARNCGFINELPIVSMTCASMGKKKTTIITDMALSQQVMFRQKAFELLQKNDMKFPFFPWIRFEKDLQNCMANRTVYNLATVKGWVAKKRQRYIKNGDNAKRLYGYDTNRYGVTYDDGLQVYELFDVLSTYAQLYFIYVILSSIIVSNYSIREDDLFLNEGNFPIWINDFFPKETITEGRHSHVLDFDVLRLGKKVIENNPNAGSFEFGVVVITEVGKERGNNLELREVKKGTDETNQKNDLFNSWLKMCRHSATVDNFPFIKVFTDEQRPESWGADARDLCDVINIADSGVQKIALPFYVIEDMIAEIAFAKFMNLYYDFRFRRGDNTLLVYVLKNIVSWIFKWNLRNYNRFGYCVCQIEKERGTLDGKIDKKKYYLMNKKIYSKRFSTDCFSDYFNSLARESKVGIMDYLEYTTERASVEELKMQNSYFMNSLYKNASSN